MASHRDPFIGEQPGNVAFKEKLPGDILLMGDRNSLRFYKGKKPVGPSTLLAVGKELPGSRIQVLFADREGCLWIGTNGGLARWAAGKLQLLPVTDPLASASVLALMEDREGNIWRGPRRAGCTFFATSASEVSGHTRAVVGQHDNGGGR